MNLKFKNLVSYIFAEDENLSLENRLFFSSIVVGIFFTLIGSIVNLIYSSSLIAGLISLFLSGVLMIMYYFIRFKKIIEPFILPLIITAQIGISIVWIINGGIDGTNIAPGLVILILSLITVSNKLKIFVISLFITLNIIIYLIQYYRPDLIVHFATEKERWIDSLLTVIYSSFVMFLIVKFLHKNYILEKNKAENKEKQLQQLYSKLKESNLAKDKFFSIIAHDLISPIGILKIVTKELHESFNDYSEKEKFEFIENLKNSSYNAFELLENLLEWANNQRDMIKFEPFFIDLNSIINNIIKLLELTTFYKSIKILNKVPYNTVVYADIILLEIILRNLISNAIKFTNKDGLIEVGINTKKNKDSEHIEIYIKDNGVGMDKNTLTKLFRIDESVSTTGTNDEKGTGLGLILCKEFIEKHGGKIWVESVIDQGSIFYFTLPGKVENTFKSKQIINKKNLVHYQIEKI